MRHLPRLQRQNHPRR